LTISYESVEEDLYSRPLNPSLSREPSARGLFRGESPEPFRCSEILANCDTVLTIKARAAVQ